MPIDVLIVGQGLAGSLLAWELLKQGMQVVVVDPDKENASKVAAGLINPVTGQRLVKTAGVDVLLPAAVKCYEDLSRHFNQDFFVPMQMLRILKTAREQHYAQQRLHQIDYENYIDNAVKEPGLIHREYPVLLQHQTGYLKTRPLLEQLRQYLLARGCYRQTRLEYADIQLIPELSWQDLQPGHLIFCEGYQGIHNPWFGHLPFQPAKGEILNCQSVQTWPKKILNFGYWLIPQDNQSFRIGATFEPGLTDPHPSSQAKEQLLNGVGDILPALQPIKVSGQQVGIRPSTQDKQPFIGQHPRYANLHIFNGFGSKGSLAIPWYARQYAASLKSQTRFSDIAQVQRYHATHFPH